MYKMTKHAQIDRYDRICGIMDSIGFGEPCLTLPYNDDPDKRYVITTTGVLLIIGRDNCLITAYVATLAKAMAIYRNNKAHTATKRLPETLYRTLKNNERIAKQHPEWA